MIPPPTHMMAARMCASTRHWYSVIWISLESRTVMMVAAAAPPRDLNDPVARPPVDVARWSAGRGKQVSRAPADVVEHQAADRGGPSSAPLGGLRGGLAHTWACRGRLGPSGGGEGGGG